MDDSYVREIVTTNPDEALLTSLQDLSDSSYAIARQSRAGPTMEYPGLSVTTYVKPRQKIPFLPVRDLNPFFSLFECLWYMDGGDDLQSMLYFNSKFGQYSDDGKIIRGSAYGKRWRSWFGHDQLDYIRKEYESNPQTRRIVVTMWDAASDPLVVSKDVPCNLMVLFNVRHEKLDMTVYNRSNDVIYGAYGSNVIHFSFFHEYVALMLGLGIGIYQQVSNCSHVYLENEVAKRLHSWMYVNGQYISPYETDEAVPVPLLHAGETLQDLDQDIALLIRTHKEGLSQTEPRGLSHLVETDYGTKFFQDTVIPMMTAWKLWKEKKGARKALEPIQDALSLSWNEKNDWLIAGRDWMQRRVK